MDHLYTHRTSHLLALLIMVGLNRRGEQLCCRGCYHKAASFLHCCLVHKLNKQSCIVLLQKPFPLFSSGRIQRKLMVSSCNQGDHSSTPSFFLYMSFFRVGPPHNPLKIT
eukprot:Lithocolla_globosa_v1_NODE_1758_length_2360_cov_4.501518.p3 type:complete len:110 gc:universal NODE_1758_length_2360_cov_4.501518:1283-954(-)